MRSKALSISIAALLSGATAVAFADDGERLLRSVSSPPGETQNPEPEGEHAFIQVMNFHVPAQSANGDLRDADNPLVYKNIDGVEVKTEVKAKPLVNVYVYGPVIGFDDFSQSGFPGHGRRDAFGAVSLDDGETWKVTNLSNSADQSSFEVSTPLPDPGLPHDGSGGIEFEVTSDTPTVTETEYEQRARGGVLHAQGEDAGRRQLVYVRDAVTREVIKTDRASREGEWEIEARRLAVAPCYIQAGDGADSWGPVVAVEGAPAECADLGTGGNLITAYPGDVTNVFHSVAGNKILVAWQSKFCSSGFPGYTRDVDTIAGYLGIDNTEDLYLTDLFGVAGSQGSTDYREQEAFPGEYDGVGEVPYNCLWTARGVLRENPETEDTTEVVWFQAERLTSGRRDVNRIETACVAGGGCAVSWQEDPEGLRPGEGEGAGTGWAGATTNSQTDIWYSFIEWEDFDILNDEGEPLADNILDTGRPIPYVPMMVPVRLTNNARCQTEDTTAQYCNGAAAIAYGVKNQCVGTVNVALGNQGNTQAICVVDANGSGELDTGDMPNVGNTAASRPRLNLQPRDSNADGATDDAWVIIIHEEDKGLGRFGFSNNVAWDGSLDNTGTSCGDPDTDLEDNCVEADIGKNQWYISFALGTPQTSASEADIGLVDNLVAQQNMYNAPEVNWRTGTFYPPNNTADMWNFDADGTDLNYSIFNTEIARRASLMSQSVAKAKTGTSGLMAMPLFKEGTINQGGPADIMARRIVVALDGGGEACPIEVDADAPVVADATLRMISTGGWRLQVTVTDFDGDPNTRLQLRNAVTEDLYGSPRAVNETGDSVTYNINADTWNQIPCAIQVADWDVPSPTFGGWIGVDTTALPEGESCVGEIPPECNTATAALAAIDEANANPYDFANMVCEWYDGEGGVTRGTKLFTDGSNPYYPKGLCTAPAINLSARTPYTCEASGGSDGNCPGVADMTCVDDGQFGQLCLTTTDPEDNQQLDKLLSWYECPGSNGDNVGGTGAEMPECYTEPDSALLAANLDDRSWYMPTEISKAHRGFLDGDFVSLIYAWSPNFKQNADGSDRYELYTRRSFNGGVSWTTTPSSFTASDGFAYSGNGTVTCETWRDGDGSLTDSHVCTEYGAGVPEQSRNVTQHKSMRVTTLDPRYTPTIASMPTAGELDWLLFEPIDPTDIRDPSRYFIVYETGDNTTVSEGEAEPLNLDYGRAEVFGDHFTVWSEIDTNLSSVTEDCYPSNPHGTTDVAWAAGTGFCNEFDTMEGFPDALSEEASITSSAYGDFLYGVWGQFNVDDNGEFVDGDSMFRRIWYLDDFISVDNSYTLPGDAQ